MQNVAVKKSAFMTMDVESFFDADFLLSKNISYDRNFSCEEFVKNYADLLDKYGIKGTFFVVAGSLDKAGLILKDALADGHEIALHGLNHVSPFDMTLNEFRQNISEGKKFLEQYFNVEVKGYRAPCFGIDDERCKIIRELGFTFDSSSLDFSAAVKSGKINLESYKKCSSTVYKSVELPGASSFTELVLPKEKFLFWNVPVGGGAYIRLFPWCVSKHLLKKYIKTHDSYIFYVHPFEISNIKIPKIKNISAFERMYLNLFRKSYLKKIEWIIKLLKKNNYEFKKMGEV